MSICNNCGKGGFFFKTDRNGLCPECAKIESSKIIREGLLRNDKEYAALDKELKTQDEQIERINAARSRFQKDNDYLALITVFETVFIKERTTLNINKLELAELYYKAELYDKAWAYANSLLLDKRNDVSKIRYFMCKVLKNEKKYPDAMLMLMLSYLYKSKWNNTFQSEMFIKDATPIANKLKWDASKVQYLASLIDNQVKKKRYDESVLIEKFKTFVSGL